MHEDCPRYPLAILKSPSKIMCGSGAGRDRINSLVLVIISSKSDNGLDGGLYSKIIIRYGLSIFTMSKSHTELEYFRQIL